MNSQRLQIVFSLLMSGLMFAGDAWSAQAGRMQFVNGDVEVTTATGVTHAAHKGDPVNEGDTITSAKTASAQVKMQDGGFIAVRPDTKLKFDSFKFGGKAGEPENSFFSLFKGGFRAVTGLIGRIRKDDYHITTPVATIGIRGTDHETVLVLPDNPLVAAGQAEPGAYNKVNLGETSITTDKGTVNVLPNQMGFAGGLNQMPEIKPINTSLFTVVPKPSPGANMDSGKGGDQGARETAVVDTNASATGDTTDESGFDSASELPSIVPPTVVPTLPTSGFAPGVYPGLYEIASFGSSSSSGMDYTGFYLASNGTLGTYTFDATGLTRYDCGTACFLDIGTAQNLDTGGVLGVIEWGRWSNGTITAGGSANGLIFGTNQGWAWIVGTPTLQLPITGNYSFNLIGGTSPTVSDGVGNGLGLGHLISGSAGVNFGAGTINGNLLMGFNGGSSTFNTTYNGSIANLLGTGGLNNSNYSASTTQLTGPLVCDGTCPSTQVQGQFYGANAKYLGIGYWVTTNSGFNINGVAAYKR